MMIYMTCLALGLLFTVASAFLGHELGGHDAVGAAGQADGGLDTGGAAGPGLFSPTVLASFLTAFGAFGLIFTSLPATRPGWISAPLAFVGGVGVALAVLWAFSLLFRKTESSSEGRVRDLIGQPAAIISPIPADGVGEISYVQAGSRYTAPARHEQPGGLPCGCTVRITRVVGTQFFVTATPPPGADDAAAKPRSQSPSQSQSPTSPTPV